MRETIEVLFMHGTVLSISLAAEVQWPKSITIKKKNTQRTAKERGHPHKRPARQLRRGVEPRLTYKVKKTGKRPKRQNQRRETIPTDLIG